MEKVSLATRSKNLSLSLTAVKTFLKVDCTDDDLLIKRLVIAALDYFESMTGIVLSEKEYYYYNDRTDTNQVIPRTPITEVTDLMINTKSVEVEEFTKNIGGTLILKVAKDYEVECYFKAGSDNFNDEYYSIIMELIAYWYEFRQSETLPDYLISKINKYIPIC
jgi:hypothetical protein